MRRKTHIVVLSCSVGLMVSVSARNTVPLCAGLTIVTAINQREGDYESIKTINSVDAGGVHLKYSTERVARDLAGHPLQTLQATRTVHAVDLSRANLYLQEFGPITPADIPGTTAIGTSTAVLTALKSTGVAELGMFDLPAGLPSEPPYSSDPTKHPSVFDHTVLFKLRRVESNAVAIPLTVNGDKVELPAIHATGSAEWGEKGDFFFLDDESNPLALRWRIRTSAVSAADRTMLQVVKIAYRCGARSTLTSRLENALSQSGRPVDVYDIFFSFNSDEIREESESTLTELGDILRRHPDWKLSIAGHTDGIASDAFNLDLSKRRAAAVSAALVTRFHVDQRRLTTTGYGKWRPRDTNDTPEGRARNRRVELVRLP
jgi:outer membrane protein OmpA-like peptidoglycan-associated protein